MIKIKTNVEIGNYLKEIIDSKYPTHRQFCIDYANLRDNEVIDEEVRKLTNRLSPMLKGKKSIQIEDLPYFSYLLDISCEEILSAGEIALPINNRCTIYSIASESDKAKWEEFLKNDNKYIYYADEYGNTILDYAIKFKNSSLIKYLINNGYLSLIQDQGKHITLNVDYEYDQVPTEQYINNAIFEKIKLRTSVFSVFIENNDLECLKAFQARVFPPQYEAMFNNLAILKFSDYYDEDFITKIIESNNDIQEYFLEEYPLRLNNNMDETIWIFPYIDKLIEKAVMKNEKAKALKFIDASIKHNQNVLDELQKKINELLEILNKTYGRYQSTSFTLNDVLRYLNFNEENNLVSYYIYIIHDQKPYISNIVNVKMESENKEINERIHELNEIYEKIKELTTKFKEK